MSDTEHAQTINYEDTWLLGGARTPFADYNGTLRDVSATDLGIKAAREALKATKVCARQDRCGGGSVGGADELRCVLHLARHIGLYAGLPIGVPALLVQRLCTSGFEAILQAADQIALGKSRGGAVRRHRIHVAQPDRRLYAPRRLQDGTGGVQGLPVGGDAWIRRRRSRMGDTAEELAKRYQITREETDAFAAASFDRAVKAREAGYFKDEVVRGRCRAVRARGLPDARDQAAARGEGGGSRRASAADAARSAEGAQARVQGRADGRQQLGHRRWRRRRRGGERKDATGDAKPLARIVAGATVGVPPEIMGIGPAPAIRAVLAKAGLKLADVDRFEINEAFGAQYIAVERELGLDRAKVNVNGGAIAIGHPLGATGVRCTLTLARELQRSSGRYGIATACAGGGQGVAILIENPART